MEEIQRRKVSRESKDACALRDGIWMEYKSPGGMLADGKELMESE